MHTGPHFLAGALAPFILTYPVLAATRCIPDSKLDPLLLMGGGHPVALTALAYAKGSAPDQLVAGFVFDPMPMVGPRALDIDEVVPESAVGSLRFAVRAKLEQV